jgi:transposase
MVRKRGWEMPKPQLPNRSSMELLHHQATLREEDGAFVCSRCGLINPADDTPCIPINLEPSSDAEVEN